MENLPVEMYEAILLFCDKKSIVNLNRVNTTLYHLTKNDLIKMKCDLYLFRGHRDAGILKYIIFNDYDRLKLILDLNLLNPNKSIFYNQEMCSWDGMEYVGHKLLINICVRWKRVDIVKLLINNGADVNKKNGEGVTPLMKCVNEFMNSEEIYEMVELLCKEGADPNIENDYGYIAMDTINPNYCLVVVNEIQEILRNYKSREGVIEYGDFSEEWDHDSYYEYDVDY